MMGRLFLFLFFLLFPLFSYSAPQEYFKTVQKLYVAYYQRPADPEGLLYWSKRLDQAGGSLEGIVEAFANSPESQELYGEKQVEEIIREMYLAAFNREPDPAGLEFYSSKVRNGEYSLMDVTLRILDGALGSDREVLEAKIQAAQLFTSTIDPDLDGQDFKVNYSGEEDAKLARLWLREVTEVPSLEEVKKIIDLIGRNDSGEGGKDCFLYGVKTGVASTEIYREIYLVDNETGSSLELYNQPVLSVWVFLAPDFLDENFNYKGYRPRYVLFIPENDGDPSTLEGGKILRVDLNDPNLNFKQVSSLSNACEIGCVYSDLWNWFAEVKTAGSDGRCGTYDDESYFVSTLMDASKKPVKLDGIEIVTDTSKGIVQPIDGFLIYDKREKVLKQCDENISNCKVIADNVEKLTNLTYGEDVSGGGISGLALFLINDDLYGYDRAKRKLLLIKKGLRPQMDLSKCVTYLPEGLYFVDRSGKSLLLAKLNGEVVKVVSESEPIEAVYGYTENYIIYTIKTKEGSKVKATKRGTSGKGLTISDGFPYFYSLGGVGVSNKDNLCLWDEKTKDLNCLAGAELAGITLKTEGNFLKSDFFRYFLISKKEGNKVTLLKLDPTDFQKLTITGVSFKENQLSTYMANGIEEKALLTIFHFDSENFIPDEDVYLIRLDSEEVIPVANDPYLVEEGICTGG